MSGGLLSLSMDILVLLCLGATIYYALKLSKSLDNFRRYRKEFEGVIKELNENISRAQDAVENLKLAGGKSNQDVGKTIDESRALVEELQLMNEMGDSLAKRLEALAEKNRRIAQGLEDPGEYSEYDEEVFNNIEHLETGRNGQKNNGNGESFDIHDRDFEELSDLSDEDFEKEDGGQIVDLPENLQSQAEKELFQALQKNKAKKSSGRKAS